MADKKIIVVEDDKDILEIMHLILDKDYDLHLFAIPPENFIDIIENLKPDLIILDWLIPNVITEDFIDPIKLKSPGTKIIITSAHSELENNFKDKNIDGLLPKPFGVSSLKGQIKNLLSETKSFSKK